MSPNRNWNQGRNQGQKRSTLRLDVAVVIPSIPPRAALLERAIRSVHAQRSPANSVIVAYDHGRQGSSFTRTRALRQVTNDWVAFLDDDDELLPNHLDVLGRVALEHQADVVWPWYRVAGGKDPLAKYRGRQWDSNNPHPFPIVTLVRNELAQQCSFVGEPATRLPKVMGDDRRFHQQLSELGAKFRHTPEITWVWHHDSKNTSGRPDRW